MELFSNVGWVEVRNPTARSPTVLSGFALLNPTHKLLNKIVVLKGNCLEYGDQRKIWNEC